MKSIELIRLRTAGKFDRDQALIVCRQILQSGSDKSLFVATLLINTVLDTDLCVSLCWDNTRDRHQKSILGQRIEKSISGFGLVSHSLWWREEIESTAGEKQKR